VTAAESARHRTVILEFGQAERSFRSSAVLLDDGDINGSVNRLYYALFHAARAALISESDAELPRSHAGLIAAFGARLVKSGKMDVALGKLFNRIEHERLLADYSGDVTDPVELRQLITLGESFLAAVRILIRHIPPAFGS
jgi:uncharacterized protein (UPF0332 family)